MCTLGSDVDIRELIAQEFRDFGRLSGDQLNLLGRHYELLLHWNRVLNLTRIEDPLDAARFHYCESLFLGCALPTDSLRIADIGSGAGFPGFPIAVIRPECTVTLIESNQRKSVFLRELASWMTNVSVVAQRAGECRDRFDWMVARAVVPAKVLKLGLAQSAALLVSTKEAGENSETKPIPWGRDRTILFHVKRP